MDCTDWNDEVEGLFGLYKFGGHFYQDYPKALEYYLEQMTDPANCDKL